MGMELPIRASYHVAEGFLAGPYPGAEDPETTSRRLRSFARHGVTLFVDLTHPADPLEPYEHLLERGAARVAHPIVDLGTTTIPRMVRILDDVDAAIDGGGSAYVHCWGGIGRTGTVVGCWLMRHGLDDGDPIPPHVVRTRAVSRDVGAACDGPRVEARFLTELVDAVLPRAWRRESPWHGETHWGCVTTTGLALAGADEHVDPVLVFCFGLLHDTRRQNEAVDPEHGPRAAAFADTLRDEGVLRVGESRLATLREALTFHSNGKVSPDPTIGTCWDADRLHLPRVSIELDPALLSTRAARGPGRMSEATSLRRAGPPSWDVLARRAASSA